MASLLRTPKNGCDWGPNDLLAYNIHIQLNQDASKFFDVNSLPRPAVSNEILTTLNADDMTDEANYKFVRYMDLAMDPAPADESAVVDFTVCLLTILGYVSRKRLTRTRVDIPLTICGEQHHSRTDVCVVDEDDFILLLVQEDKRHKDRKDPEPQLVAQAIAAFQSINTRRTRVLGQYPIDAKVMLGIILVGSSPTFYEICVTRELAQAVALGQFPAKPTVMYAHLPEIRRPSRRLIEGMKPLDNRRSILACYQAFKEGIVDW